MIIAFFSHQVVWLMGFYLFSGTITGFYPISGLIKGPYPDSYLIYLQW